MKNSIQKITKSLQPLGNFLYRYRITLFIVSFVTLYGFLVIQINNFTNREPDPAAVTEKQQTIRRLKIDQDSIDRILELEEQNIDVKTLFEQARQNPFNE